MTLHAVTQALAAEYPEVPPHLIDEALLWYIHGHVAILATDPVSCAVREPEDPDTYLVSYTATGSDDLPVRFACDTCSPDEAITCLHALAAQIALLATTSAHEHDPEMASSVTSVTSAATETRQHEPCSLSLGGTTQRGYDILLCFRGYDVDQLMQQARQALGQWEVYGWGGKYGRTQQVTYAEKMAEQPESPPQRTSHPPSPPTPPIPPSPPVPPQGLVFTVDRIEASFLNKKWYWAVFGPDMPRSRVKHGVRIWEEGLKTAGLDPATMDPTNPPDLTGYLAHYIMKDDGTPDKIIRLLPGNH